MAMRAATSKPAPQKSMRYPPRRREGDRSTSVGLCPPRSNQNASVGPAMPAPTTRMSMGPPMRAVRAVYGGSFVRWIQGRPCPSMPSMRVVVRAVDDSARRVDEPDEAVCCCLLFCLFGPDFLFGFLVCLL